jgi:polysaccharide deacetylase 2 family uncharacterized protein YibQ
LAKKSLVFFIVILYKKLAMAKKKLPAKGRSRGKGGGYDRTVIVGIIVALIAISLILWGPLRKYRIGEEKTPAPQVKKFEPSSKKAAQEKPEKPEKKRKLEKPAKRETKEAKKRDEVPAVKPSEKAALIAIVIDDLGQDLKPAREILSLPGRITYAVMPGLAQSRKVAELAKQNNHEVLLHLPMEYRGKNGKPAPGMLRSDMTPMDFLNTVSEDMGSVPAAVGVNNHEGSSLTENKEAMKFLMAELKARDLVFLDSLTSPKSVAYATAKEFGLKAAKRDVFLDNESDNAEYIGKQLEELAHIAKEHGRAIGIGHPHPATISALRKWLAKTSQQGIEIVPVSRLMQ